MLSPGDYPKKAFENISKIENECSNYTRSLDKETFMSIVMSASTAVYKPVITIEKKLRGNSVEISNLKSAMT